MKNAGTLHLARQRLTRITILSEIEHAVVTLKARSQIL